MSVRRYFFSAIGLFVAVVGAFIAFSLPLYGVVRLAHALPLSFWRFVLFFDSFPAAIFVWNVVTVVGAWTFAAASSHLRSTGRAMMAFALVPSVMLFDMDWRQAVPYAVTFLGGLIIFRLASVQVPKRKKPGMAVWP